MIDSALSNKAENHGTISFATKRRATLQSVLQQSGEPRSNQFCNKAEKHAPISFDRQAQVFQGKCYYYSTEVHGGGGLELVKPARDPVSGRPKS